MPKARKSLIQQSLRENLSFRKPSHFIAFFRVLSRYWQRKTVVERFCSFRLRISVKRHTKPRFQLRYGDAERKATRLGAFPTIAFSNGRIFPFSVTSIICSVPSPMLLTNARTGLADSEGMRSMQQGFETVVSRSSSAPDLMSPHGSSTRKQSFSSCRPTT